MVRQNLLFEAEGNTQTAARLSTLQTKTENPLPKERPGAICAQMVRCGKASCKCVGGALHGPYYYHFFRVKGVLIKRYIKNENVSLARAACDARRADEKLKRKAIRKSAHQLSSILERIRRGEAALLEVLEANSDRTE
jgi:hypothetical protein